MSRDLNLDKSKMYATDVSTDGGRTWEGIGGTHCSAMVEADVAVADREGHRVDVRDQVVTINDGVERTRWTPTS